MYAVEEFPVVAGHVVGDLSRAEDLEETARSNLGTFLIRQRRLRAFKQPQTVDDLPNF